MVLNLTLQRQEAACAEPAARAEAQTQRAFTAMGRKMFVQKGQSARIQMAKLKIQVKDVGAIRSAVTQTLALACIAMSRRTAAHWAHCVRRQMGPKLTNARTHACVAQQRAHKVQVCFVTCPRSNARKPDLVPRLMARS